MVLFNTSLSTCFIKLKLLLVSGLQVAGYSGCRNAVNETSRSKKIVIDSLE